MKPKSQPLLVTTAHKGVFFGYGKPTSEPTITLQGARMCVYWSAEVKGVFGLASVGPLKGCKVGPAVPELTLRDVTACAVCSSAAVTEWEKGIWN